MPAPRMATRVPLGLPVRMGRGPACSASSSHDRIALMTNVVPPTRPHRSRKDLRVTAIDTSRLTRGRGAARPRRLRHRASCMPGHVRVFRSSQLTEFAEENRMSRGSAGGYAVAATPDVSVATHDAGFTNEGFNGSPGAVDD